MSSARVIKEPQAKFSRESTLSRGKGYDWFSCGFSKTMCVGPTAPGARPKAKRIECPKRQDVPGLATGGGEGGPKTAGCQRTEREVLSPLAAWPRSGYGCDAQLRPEDR